MRQIFITTAFSFLLSLSFGQRITQITLTNSGTADIISFMTDDGVVINLSKDGKIIEWGIENTSRLGYYPGKLEKYMGRTDFYTENDNEDYRGKVRYIGKVAITYFSASENQAFKGKVKSIGSSLFDYYTPYDDEAVKGNIKTAGIVSFTYYSSFENEAYKGKFKTIGPSSLTYYSSFDDKAFRGKIKSIDGHAFVYYSSFERQEYRGQIKGFQTSYILNGIKYLLR